MTFSKLYEFSYNFIGFAISGLERFLSLMFQSLRSILTEAGWINKDAFPNLILLDFSSLTIVLGGGVLIYFSLTLFKYFSSAIR